MSLEREEQIVKECLQGDSKAQGELYSTYADYLFFVSLRYISNRTKAEDILHDAFIKIFNSLNKFQYRGKGSLKAWMVRVTINIALEHLRIESRDKINNTDDINLISNIAEPTTEEAQKIPESILKQFIYELPVGYRTVFNLYCIEEYSHKEIAEMLSINEKSSSSQLFRAKTMLAKKIKEYLTLKTE